MYKVFPSSDSLLVFKKVYALYFVVVMNCYLLMRSFMIMNIAVIITSKVARSMRGLEL